MDKGKIGILNYMNKNSSKSILIVSLVGVVLIIVALYAYMMNKSSSTPQPVVQENTETSSWETSTDASSTIVFKYPKTLPYTYISTVEWPPKAVVINGAFACSPTGTSVGPTGNVQLRTIGGHAYCVSESAEGAAGSTYTTYKYAFQKDQSVIELSFTLRFVQCLNYDKPKSDECLNEKAQADIDTLVDTIANTVRTDSVSTAQSSGILGKAMMGPTCPVEKNPPDPKCADKPYANGYLHLLTYPIGNFVKEFQTDMNGKFKVDVVPGNYTVSTFKSSSRYPLCEGEKIEVAYGAYADVAIHCDTGIR